MVGQTKLFEQLKTYSLATLPHSILLLGENGCGKHTAANEVSNMFNLPLYDITEVLSAETIDEIKLRSTPAIYLINLDELSERSQNTLLKFIEEPGINAFIILVSSSKYGILETVLNRCLIYNFEKYSSKEISQIVQETVPDDVLKICETPGQIKVTLSNYTSLKENCVNLITNINTISFIDMLSLVDKINYKDEYNKFDFYVFLKMLRTMLYTRYVEQEVEEAVKLYNIVQAECQKLVDGRLNKKLFISHLLTCMWLAVRGE